MHGSGLPSRLLRWCGAGGGRPRCAAATLAGRSDSPVFSRHSPTHFAIQPWQVTLARDESGG